MEVPFSYPEVGATADGAMPPGYAHLQRAAVLGAGQECFERAAEALLSWGVHRGAGLRVSGAPQATAGADVNVEVRLGPLRVNAPCRVVYVVDEARERGFAYGTLDGHPESGEERFTVRWQDDDEVVLVITAFSRPATWWARAAAPATKAVQYRVTRRYLRALR